MPATPTVSVVLCTFNGQSFIAQQLESILAQTLPPVEIVVGDDGSTDRTLDIVDEVGSATTIPIRVRRNTSRLGFADNFLCACQHAAGDFLAFSDQDDVWVPGKLEQQLSALERTGAAMSVHDSLEIDSDGAPTRSKSWWGWRERIVTDLTDSPWGNYRGNTVVFRRELLDRIPASERGADPFSLGAPLAHDRWLYFLGGTFGGIAVLRQRLIHYRRHDLQLYGGKVRRSVRQRLRKKREEGKTQALALAAIARDRQRLLEQYVEPGVARDRSVGRWQEIAQRYDRGATVYDQVPLRRVLRIAVNALHGDYLPVRSGGLGATRLLQDGAVALLAGRGPAVAPLRADSA